MVSVSPDAIFCCDADALINFERSGRFTELTRLVEQNRLRVVDGVYKEVAEAGVRSNDMRNILRRWKEREQVVVAVDEDRAASRHIPQIERRYGPPFSIRGITYGGFWKSRAGRDAADAEVVAFAKAYGWAVISNDRSVQGACLLEGVACLHWEHLAVVIEQMPPRAQTMTPNQLRLF